MPISGHCPIFIQKQFNSVYIYPIHINRVTDTMKKNRIDVITLGCSKNLVDSERLLKRFEDCGYEVAHDSDNVCGEVVVINTCGFIGDAKEESINTILEYVEAKRCRRVKHRFVMG